MKYIFLLLAFAFQVCSPAHATSTVTFAVHGNALNAVYGPSGCAAYSFTPNGPTAPLATTTTGFTGEIGASSIDVNVANGNGRIGWTGFNNLPSPAQWLANPGISVLSRVAFKTTATGNWSLFDLGAWGLAGPGHVLIYLSGNQLEVLQAGFNTTNGQSTATAAALSVNTYYDILWVWDGTTSSNASKLYINGSLLSQVTTTQAWATIAQPWQAISMGSVSGVGSGTWVNEFVVWSGVVDASTIASLNGNSRSSFVTVPTGCGPGVYSKARMVNK